MLLLASLLFSFAILAGPAEKAVDQPLTNHVEEHAGNGFDQPITLHEEQGGFAGTVGYRWIVEPNGKWTASVYDPKSGKSQVRSRGRLNAAQLKQLTKEITEAQLEKMPQSLGQPQKVNPHRYILQIGKRRVTLNAPPRVKGRESVARNITKAAPPADSNAGQQWRRFGRLANIVERSCRK